MMSYIYGFFSSGIVFAALHAVFPARAVDEFVKNDMTAAEVQRHFSERWEKDSPEARPPVALPSTDTGCKSHCNCRGGLGSKRKSASVNHLLFSCVIRLTYAMLQEAQFWHHALARQQGPVAEDCPSSLVAAGRGADLDLTTNQPYQEGQPAFAMGLNGATKYGTFPYGLDPDGPGAVRTSKYLAFSTLTVSR